MEIQGPRIDTLEHNETYGKFIVEPLERGYGVTLANPLRRLLLSSLRGAAITSLRIDGVLHEFATIPGLREDTTELILNLKELAIRVQGNGAADPDDEPEVHVLRIDKRGEGDITGADIECPSDVEIMNPEVHIATLADENASLTMEMTVEVNKGYVLPQEHERYRGQIGVVPVGSAFSPVRKANFALESTRVGSRSDYERLIFEIETNGTIAPGEALSEAARVLDQYVRLFFEVSSERVARPVDEQPGPTSRTTGQSAPDVRIEELDFSVRTYNCLKKANIQTVADLVRASEEELMNIRNFGRKSLVEVQEKLSQFGYTLVGSGSSVSKGGPDDDGEEE
ncbi:MAG TPA: DNA-directed RNA polymerase subunit alpha [Armatimonadota bacterium]|nr:DNA-directed RNA polymerase subunit alpha [Armatimonadota bacterium]